MIANRYELKTFTREEWLVMDNQALEDQLKRLDEEYPLVLHTDLGRTFSTVRRMQAEQAMGLPVNLRTGFAISVKIGKVANELTDDEWKDFYNSLTERLKGDYPDFYKRLFSSEKTRS